MTKLIKENCEPGSVVHSDGWAAYLGIPWCDLKIRHERHVKKTVNNEEVRTFVEANLIEGLWGTLKQYIKHSYNTLMGDEGTYYDFIQEALWRRKLRKLETPQERRDFIRMTFRHQENDEVDLSRTYASSLE